jgi:high affinity cGMP-specific 3',5'-cyclic phosphodiesterase 9
MDHPGVSAQFLSKADKGLIVRDALLEKHHALRAFGAMADRDIRMLDGVTSAQYYQFRSSVSKIILATDFARHSDYLARLQEFSARRAEDPAVEMDSMLAMELMVKCADVSNVVKPVEVARRWTLRATDEFFVQGDAERCMGMQVSPNCDRLATSRVAIQAAFIAYLGPLFTHLAAAFPGLDTPLAQLGDCRAYYALCTDLDLEGARDWEEERVAVLPSLRSVSVL